ncbi:MULTISPECIES: YybH family protein [Pseudomonas]|uniref:YybH family protein n=1 Tax=Pseudomonas TaxID=286 RepID=UPI0010C0AD84|nr:nuclear transport factor 2 family protein [Pseudomonas asiatica]EKT4468589.1 nuclear transport factor 2 family protein [Pseudomonas putida]
MTPAHRLEQLLERWSAAAFSWNATALGACYTSDAGLLGGRPGHSVGRPAIVAYFASYDGVIRSGTVQALDQEVSQPAADVVIAQGHVRMSFVLEDGRETVSQLRSTLVLRLEAGEWKIWRHHFSPIPEAPPLGDN